MGIMSSGNKHKKLFLKHTFLTMTLDLLKRGEIFLAFARRRKFKEEKSLSRKLYLIYPTFLCLYFCHFHSISKEQSSNTLLPKNDKVLNCLSGTIFYLSSWIFFFFRFSTRFYVHVRGGLRNFLFLIKN